MHKYIVEKLHRIGSSGFVTHRNISSSSRPSVVVLENRLQQQPTLVPTSLNRFDLRSFSTQFYNKSGDLRNLQTRTMTSSPSTEHPEYTNRLVNEKSTYLLQHAHNPVDWYPWGDEAIAKAKAEKKLIFLSVGYSTCHWCHVMEKESFENPDIAAVMNRDYVNIKVDREERPDLDRIYMNFVVMINGSGGWPMSVWLTPDLAPISAGTYFPPVDRWGTPGFSSVLKKVHEKWTADHENLTRVGLRVIDVMRQTSPERTGTENVVLSTEDKFNEAVRIFKRNVDSEWGGFGKSPKFPEVSKLNFLLHANTHKPDPEVLAVPLKTLDKIAEGGIHDHVFGGFARYSVDRKWHIPHFEKMLYDQGQLLQAYVHSYKIKQNPAYLDVSDKIFRYIVKDLYHPEGAFYSGEDADSYPTFGFPAKIEGAFYAWEWQELKDIYDENVAQFSQAESFDIFSHYYGIEEVGNVEPASDPQGHLLLKNILMVQTSLDATAKKYKTDIATVKATLQLFKEILHEIRDKRPRPHLDTKILTSWNGLVLSGISKLASISEDADRKAEYIRVARKLVAFVKSNLYDASTKTIYRTCYGDGIDSEAKASLGNPIAGFLDDYAFLIKGLLDYYLVTLDVEILRWARELQTTQDRLFWDVQGHGYFYSHENAANVVVRLKDDHDGAEPCGNSVATSNLLLLHGYFEDEPSRVKAAQVFEYFAQTTPFGYMLPEMMSAMLLYDVGFPVVVVVGPTDSDIVQELLAVVRSYFIPGLILVQHDPNNPDQTTRTSAKQMKQIDGKPAVYLCHNQTCEMAITNAADLHDKLGASYLFK